MTETPIIRTLMDGGKIDPVTYTCNTESKALRIVKYILSILIVPIALYNVAHALVGLFILPAVPMGWVKERTCGTPLLGWKESQLTVEVDGYKIDAKMVWNRNFLNKGRWALISNGNAEFHEDMIGHMGYEYLWDSMESNVLLFNYPGVGKSTGVFPSKQAMVKAYRAMLTFLEDKEKGVGAREIIGYGHSIGGGVQGEVLKSHRLRDDVDYVFVKSRTFSDLSTAVVGITRGCLGPLSHLAGILIKLLGWNLDSVESSTTKSFSEIVLQTGVSGNIIDDGIITKNASLGEALERNRYWTERRNKRLLVIKERHNHSLEDSTLGLAIK